MAGHLICSILVDSGIEEHKVKACSVAHSSTDRNVQLLSTGHTRARQLVAATMKLNSALEAASAGCSLIGSNSDLCRRSRSAQCVSQLSCRTSSYVR